MSAVTTADEQAAAREAVRVRAVRRGRRGTLRTHVFLFTVAVVWLFPILYALYTSLRPYSDTAQHGYASLTTHSAWSTSRTPGPRPTCRTIT